MPVCTANKANGEACTKPAKEGQTLCGIHARSVAIRAQREAGLDPNAARMFRPVEQRIAEAQQELARLNAAQQVAAAQLRQAREAARVQRLGLNNAAQDPRRRLFEDHQRDPVGDVNLRAFGQDKQSVHRGSVQSASEIALGILMQRPVPAGQDTIGEIEATWRVLYTGNGLEQILKELKTDVSPERNLEAFSHKYTTVLDHVWATIKANEHRKELAKRLFQEVYEGYKMCSNGKMCRLLNVLQGYDDQVVANISRDAFQSKFATLTSLPSQDRETAAKAVFAEYGIPDHEHSVWLEPLLEV